MKNKDSVIRFRENAFIKSKASAILSSMGIDLSSALRMFLRQVIKNKGIPFQMEGDLDQNLTLMYSSMNVMFDELERK